MNQETWEDVNCPSIHEMFVYYNDLYFEGKLSNSSVEWSEKMTLCGGICYYQRGSNASIIRLSKPLLSLRPSWELKNTLIHEMIHAWQYVQNIREANRQHGNEFLLKCGEINHSTKPDHLRPARGYKITTFHTMIDEVNHYRTHVWQCDTCGKQVKRSTNRKPQPADCKDYSMSRGEMCTNRRCYYHIHIRACKGSFTKIAEPEDYGKKKRKKKKDDNVPNGDSVPKRKKRKDESKKISEFFKGKSYKAKRSDSEELEHQKSKDAEKRRQGNDEAGPSRNLGWNESEPEDDDTNDECIDLSSGSSDEETEQTQGKQMGVRETNENGETPLRESTLFRLWEPEDAIRKTSQEENPKGRISGNLKAEALYHDCPNCNKRVPVSELNSHLDSCLEMDLIVID